MGSGSSKKAPKSGPKRTETKTTVSSSSLSSSSASSRKNTMDTPKHQDDHKKKEVKEQEVKKEEVKEQRVMEREKSCVKPVGGGGEGGGGAAAGARWETFNIDQLMKELNALDKVQHWYDVIDRLITSKTQVITPVTKRKGWRTVRLFISSTFKDMHSEREHLVKLTIPVLRQWCHERHLNLIECDLRWGVPKNADTRETLVTCLSEIDRCRQENEFPYFLSMLSERYGYVMDPADVPDDIKARYKWLPGMSVTSLEIMTGAYWDKNPNALFMMRKPGFVKRLDEDLLPAYTETDHAMADSLAVLKKKLKDHFPERVKEYDCTVEGRDVNRAVLGSLEDFGQTVLDHFKARIAAQFPSIPADQQMTITEMKRADQEEFMLQRSQVLLGREAEVEQIDAYIRGNSNNILTLAGYPGAGKSALMAFSTKQWLKDPTCKVFFHFVGVTPDSTSVYSVLSRLYRESMPQDQQDSMPVDPDDMARFTPTMFSEATSHTLATGHDKLIVFIDALNQLDNTGSSHKLTWLPRQLPQGMRVVVSALEGLCLESLRSHTFPAQELVVKPLNVEIRRQIVQEWLQPYNKRLDDEQLTLLVKKEDAGRPLFLSIACEELRVFGEFRKLTNKIRELSDELTGLVEIVLRRTVQEFGEDLVQATLCLIETSHFGLEEEELLHLLNVQPTIPTSPTDCSPSDFRDKLPMASWGFVYVGLRSFLRPSGSSGEGRVDFYHRSISKVVRQMYLLEPEQRAKWHGRLIQFFSGRANMKRKAEELPYHYLATGNMEGLRRCLLDQSMFQQLYTETSKQLLMQYWQKAGGYPLAAASYQTALKDYLSLKGLEGTEEGDQLSTKVAWFMVDVGQYDLATELLDHIISQISERHGNESVQLADPLHAVMALLMYKALKYVYGSHPGYKACVRRGRAIVERTVKVQRLKHPAGSNALANVLSLCAYFDHNLLEECRTIFTSNNNKTGLAIILYMMGEKNQYHNDINVPIRLFKESLALCKVYFGQYHLNTARCEQLYGQLFWNNWTHNTSRREWLDECLGHYVTELDILQEILGHDHPTTVRSREDVIIILQSLGLNTEADRYLAKQPSSRDGIA